MTTGHFQQAVKLEEAEPHQALDLYDQLQSKNTKFHWETVLAATFCPMLASTLAFLASQLVETKYEGPLTLGIIGVLGFLPPVVIFLHQLRKNQSKPQSWPLTLCVAPVLAFAALFSTAIALAADIIATALIFIAVVIPVGSIALLFTGSRLLLEPVEWPLYVFWPIVGGIFSLVLVTDLAEAEPRLSFQIPGYLNLGEFVPEIPVGLRLNWRKILTRAAGVAVASMLAGTIPLDFLRDRLYLTVLGNGMAGALLGLALWTLWVDPPLANLIRLGQVRCVIVLRRSAEARIRLRQILQEPPSDQSPPLEGLAAILWRVQAGWPYSAQFDVNPVRTLLTTHRHRDLWLLSHSRTYSLARLLEPPKIASTSEARHWDDHWMVLRGMKTMGKRATVRRRRRGSSYAGVARVLESGYVSPGGSFSPKNAPIWIDVRVVEGVVEFNGPHSQGLFIHGIWSYGGDVLIVGEPQPGDLVGYYRDGYFQIWEKLEGPARVAQP